MYLGWSNSRFVLFSISVTLPYFSSHPWFVWVALQGKGFRIASPGRSRNLQRVFAPWWGLGEDDETSAAEGRFTSLSGFFGMFFYVNHVFFDVKSWWRVDTAMIFSVSPTNRGFEKATTRSVEERGSMNLGTLPEARWGEPRRKGTVFTKRHRGRSEERF